MMPPTGTEKVSLLELGENYSSEEWINYQRVLPAEEYEEAHLLKVLTNDFDSSPDTSPLLWAPLHACRALAQMHALSVIDPMLRLAENDYYPQASEEFARISSEIGDVAIEPIAAFLSDHARSEKSRTLAAQGLGAIGRSSTGATRERIIESLMNQIRINAKDGWVNGAAASALITMEASAAGPEVLRMYKEGRIQGFIRGEELTQYFGQPNE